MATLKTAKGPLNSEPAVLFVDDDPDTLDAYGYLFRHSPLRILTAPSGLHALDLLKTESTRVVVVVSDYWMIGMNGVTLLDEVARLYPMMGRVLLTGTPDSEIVLEARHHKILTKGMDPGLIRRAILREAGHHS